MRALVEACLPAIPHNRDTMPGQLFQGDADARGALLTGDASMQKIAGARGEESDLYVFGGVSAAVDADTTFTVDSFVDWQPV